ncbi:uncharacterized protein LOC119408373 [Nematolebias whitei]|uniref:uncharacterized protein LOC119408373 n=1 Tax=Nematolebias whitei TaxID=451745 RepID=UPI00189BD7A4|nr:uncharacterized protein LOC119408373 [Nematolebias whitei]
MGEMPLAIRREQLAINYWINLKGNNPEHPTLDILKPSWEKEKKETRSFGWIIDQKTKEMQISPVVPLPTIPPWILPNATVDLTLMDKKKDRRFIFNSYTVQDYINNYYNYIQIYTDASRTSEKVGVSYVIPEFNIEVRKRITNEVSVYTGEMLAVLLAVQWVEETRPLKTIICSDSSSTLISLQNSHSDSRPDILLELQQTLFRIQMMGLTVIFLWTPAHIGIRGNEAADRAAKAATKDQINFTISISKSEVRTIVKQKLKGKWQKQWEEEHKGRWYYRIQRQVGEMRRGGRNRREERLITRLRFGHTSLNNTLHNIQKHDTGQCEHCGQEETIEHVILVCQKYEHHRRRMIEQLGKIKETFSIINILQKEITSKSIRIIIHFFRNTKLEKRI